MVSGKIFKKTASNPVYIVVLERKGRGLPMVFSGKIQKGSVSIVDKKGKARNFNFIQGNDRGVGVKHSVFQHCNTNKNYYNPDEIALIPDIIKNGERQQEGKRVSYTLTKDGVKYTVSTEVKGDG